MKVFGKEYKLVDPATYDVDSKKIGDKLYIYDPNIEIVFRFTKTDDDNWEPKGFAENGDIYPSYGEELDDELIQKWVQNAADGLVHIIDTENINESF